jgi:hypothetical protein
MNIKRMRGRNHRSGGSGPPIRHQGGGGAIPLNRNHVFDSSGPDVRIRGTAQQLFEKYLQLGRDANASGDRVLAESYFQHAEHYFRIVNAINQAQVGGPSQRNALQAESPEGEDEADTQAPGLGEQPASGEAREIPIIALGGDG